MKLKRSPLAPACFPRLPAIAGVRVGATECGVKYQGRTDLFVAEFDPGTTIAGVLTQSQTASAPVEWCRTALPGGRVRAIVANSGNANAFTGSAGESVVRETVRAVAGSFGCAETDVFVASTGVIGEPIPPEIIPAGVAALRPKLSPMGWAESAAAIMTTDTFPKGATRTAKIGGRPVTINGIAKGSGMIAPDMATMLGFIVTDAAIPVPVLQTLIKRAADRSFNCITVDSDTSTSDTLLLCATGKADHPVVTSATDRSLGPFRGALEDLAIDLAQQVVRDGEGASKFITIKVTGAVSARAARRIGLTIANSPLVKTAVAGEDANWGRIVMATGKAGEKADRDRMAIAIGGIPIAENGKARTGFDEAPVAVHMKGQDILIEVDVGVGRGRSTVWTCDLTHGYIEINADYRS